MKARKVPGGALAVVKNGRIGHSLAGRRQAPGEARYYMPEGARKKVPCVFAETHGDVPWPYGGFCLESMDSHGGWIASAPDLARVAAALDDPLQNPVLGAESIRRLAEPPAPPVARTHGKLDDSAIDPALHRAANAVKQATA
jgi:hypothetical protein